MIGRYFFLFGPPIFLFFFYWYLWGLVVLGVAERGMIHSLGTNYDTNVFFFWNICTCGVKVVVLGVAERGMIHGHDLLIRRRRACIFVFLVYSFMNVTSIDSTQ